MPGVAGVHEAPQPGHGCLAQLVICMCITCHWHQPSIALQQGMTCRACQTGLMMKVRYKALALT